MPTSMHLLLSALCTEQTHTLSSLMPGAVLNYLLIRCIALLLERGFAGYHLCSE